MHCVLETVFESDQSHALYMLDLSDPGCLSSERSSDIRAIFSARYCHCGTGNRSKACKRVIVIVYRLG